MGHYPQKITGGGGGVKRERVESTEILNQKNLGGFSLSYTFVPAIVFSIKNPLVLLVVYSSF